MHPCHQAAATFFPTISPPTSVQPAPVEPSPSQRPPTTPRPVAPGVIGLLIFLGTEAMFFAGLMSAFVILRAGQVAWPPPGQPRLPAAVTGVNTLILLASAVTMRRALAAIRADRGRAAVRWLAATVAFGLVFLTIQGSEWTRLLNHGLSVTASVYGALFYTLIGAHGLHALGGLGALAVTLGRAQRARYSAAAHQGIALCWIYWGFVVGVWPVLYVLVYLA
jgi:heme/copper-type cytochrome/quinol oxidase subunit 3